MKKNYLLFLILALPFGCFAEQTVNPLVILTGATGQLGSPIAHHLHANYSLFLIGRQPQKLLTLQQNLPNSQTLPLDYTSPKFLHAYKHTLEKLTQKVHSLIIITPRPEWHTPLQDIDTWQKTLLITFSAQAALIKATLPYMEKQSSILIIAGTTSIQLQPQYGLSCILRRMWTTYAKALSHELGPQGIRVNSLSPGVVFTPFHKKRLSDLAYINNRSIEEEIACEATSIPLRRFCEVTDVATSAEFLISQQASFISGINLILDGGFSVALN